MQGKRYQSNDSQFHTWDNMGTFNGQSEHGSGGSRFQRRYGGWYEGWWYSGWYEGWYSEWYGGYLHTGWHEGGTRVIRRRGLVSDS